MGLANYLVTPLRAFQATQHEQSKLVPKVYKLALMYYSLLMYYLRADEGIRRIGSREEIVLPGYEQPFGELEFCLTVQHKQELGEFAHQQRKRINQGKEQIKDFLKAKIFPQLEDILKEEPTNFERIILQEIHITQKAMDDFRRHHQVDAMDATLALYFRRLVCNLYQTAAQLQVHSPADLKIYLALLYTARLGKYGNGELPPPLAHIMQMGRESLTEDISAIKNE